jgi:hypothetical protein
LIDLADIPPVPLCLTVGCAGAAILFEHRAFQAHEINWVKVQDRSRRMHAAPALNGGCS